jgi:predicted Fe-Mo cluster-binding NifX family protein
MLVAIPTINQKLITRRFGRMTEITFVEVENHSITNQFIKKIVPHPLHQERHLNRNHEYESGMHKDRHNEIKDNLNEADIIVYKSLCKNWRNRLADSSQKLKRTNNELLSDVLEEISLF